MGPRSTRPPIYLIVNGAVVIVFRFVVSSRYVATRKYEPFGSRPLIIVTDCPVPFTMSMLLSVCLAEALAVGRFLICTVASPIEVADEVETVTFKREPRVTDGLLVTATRNCPAALGRAEGFPGFSIVADGEGLADGLADGLGEGLGVAPTGTASERTSAPVEFVPKRATTRSLTTRNRPSVPAGTFMAIVVAAAVLNVELIPLLTSVQPSPRAFHANVGICPLAEFGHDHTWTVRLANVVPAARFHAFSEMLLWFPGVGADANVGRSPVASAGQMSGWRAPSAWVVEASPLALLTLIQYRRYLPR